MFEFVGNILRWFSTERNDESESALFSTTTYRGRGLIHRIMWAPVEAALETLPEITLDDQPAPDTTKRLIELEFLDRAQQAEASARKGGGAWLWLAIKEPEGVKQSDPISWEQPHEISAIHVVTKDEATIAEFETDYLSPRMGQARLVTINMIRDSVSVSATVHATRLIYFPGAPIAPDEQGTKQGYDASVLDLYMEAICGVLDGYDSVAKFLKRLSMPWVNMPKGIQSAASDPTFDQKMATLKAGLDSAGLGILFGDDTMSWQGPSTAGARELMDILLERICSIEGIPLSEFYGSAPAGLSSDDEAGKRTYERLLNKLRGYAGLALGQTVRVMTGRVPKLEWPPYEEQSEKEKAEEENLFVDRDIKLLENQIITESEIRERIRSGGSTLPLDDAAYLATLGMDVADDEPE